MGLFASTRLVVVLGTLLGACAADADGTPIEGRGGVPTRSVATDDADAQTSVPTFRIEVNGVPADDPAIHDFGEVAQHAAPSCCTVAVVNLDVGPLTGGPIDVDGVFSVSGPLPAVEAGRTERFAVCAATDRVGGHETTVVLPFGDYTLTFEVDVVGADPTGPSAELRAAGSKRNAD